MNVVFCRVHEHVYDIDGILFDKDGTIIDFGSLWIEWARRVIDQLDREMNGELDRNSLASAIGLDLENKTHDPEGPLLMGTINDIRAIMAQKLYEMGIAWNEAVQLVVTSQETVDQQIEWQQLVKPKIGIHHLLHRAKEAGIKMGIFTADDTMPTIKQLKLLELEHYFKAVIGNDQVQRGKPFPDMVELACEQLDLNHSKTIIIGDSNGDMMLGINSGLQASIGIVDPGNQGKHLKAADVNIDSFRMIQFNGLTEVPE